MKNQDSAANTAATATILERIAQGIIIAHAWVAGPAMTEKQRIQRELVKAKSVGEKGAGIAG